jgi:hypothetical protein
MPSSFMTFARRHFLTLLIMPCCLQPMQNVACAQDTAPPAAESPSASAPDAAPPSADPVADGEATPSPEAQPAGEKTETPAEVEKPAEPEIEIPFARQPYMVRASIAFEADCLVEEEKRKRIVIDIERAIVRMYGRLWETVCDQNDWMVPADHRHLGRLGVTDVIDRYPEQEFHKAFIVSIERDGTSFVISCREFDSRIHELTPIRFEVTQDERSIANTAVRLMRDTFRPMLTFQRAFPGENQELMMEMQVQGGEIIPPDPSAEQVVTDDVLRPFVRQMDRRDPTKLKRLQALPLTYLRVMDIDTVETRGKANTVFITHLRAQMFGGKGRRTEYLAVRQRPGADRSRVRLILKGREDKPLISHRLALAYQLNWRSEEDGPQAQLVSDRNGEVVIETREGHPTFWIRVYSGSSLLARVPYAPGLIPSDTIELPDDSIRLGVEGEIQLLADELVDAIALREVTIARAKKAAEAGNTTLVEELLYTYKSVPGKEYFLEQASNIRVSSERESKLRNLRNTMADRLCKTFSETIETFFTDEKRSARQLEIQQIRATAEQKADVAGN